MQITCLAWDGPPKFWSRWVQVGVTEAKLIELLDKVRN